ncbi:MAG: flagellar export chaperone FliS [Chloroflexota bacterium]
MPLANPYQRYQSTSVQTADPAQLLLLTYEAIVRWLNRAETAVMDGNLARAHEGLLSAQALLRDLSTSLDFEQGDVAWNLARLYDYMIERLVAANVAKDKAIVAEVRALVVPLLEAWRVAVVQARRQGLVQAS